MNENDSIIFGTSRISYEIIYSARRKNVSISVSPDKKVKVLTPSTLTPEAVKEVMKRKADWVLKKLEWFDHIQQFDASKEYVSGETFLYMGRQYRLKILSGDFDPSAKLKGRYFEVTIPKNTPQESRQQLVRDVLWKWYLEHAESKLTEILKAYSLKLHIDPPRLKVKHQVKRWGSCSKDNIIRLNIQIIMAPMKQIQYVVAHELCHIKHKSHSSDFWKSLRLIMPDYELRKESLRRDGWRYVL
ncbi:SprT family zinc-dependent metalloprotease [Methanosarcina sp.]|uniref:M48 family metallopeptidase n=1 Tax=Methanosarcina sp. TaxID=2213 RepID=UPI0029884E9F|nr:SprT family zinc-dependent metalloprotease [Methanosarcina sp.]MDW5551646.1 SprT family zinc-dependent metalloprotease [Methanosarcina sp.]MDW5555545.1 SprT family zinc-dependent metalloprotease [Methanosarcina sp.]MDW5561105.1 SprT family zinc-dependent metalloprotease [Methanosarcina sp.]